MQTKIMAINSGSSSLKFQLFVMPEEDLIVKGLFERIGSAEGISFSYTLAGEKKAFTIEGTTHEEAVAFLIDFLLKEKVIESLEEITGVGHRVAHGGEYFSSSSLVEEKEEEMIRELSKLAPLHNPVNLAGIEAFKQALPEASQVAVFDTSFHQTLPKSQYLYPIPMSYYREDKIRKYGFHGTSHQFVAQEAANIMEKPLEELKLITCHLGNGASICGIKNGQSQITSMGFTPIAGLMMGTRSGDLDPSVVTFIQEEKGLSASEMNQVLNNESGLLGVSELSNDFRDVIASAEDNVEQSVVALDIFTSKVKQTIGAYAAELGGVDGIIFTAGIGENSAWVREKCCEGLEFLGAKIDKELNKTSEEIISTTDSSTTVLVVPTNEELMIAKETMAIISSK
ncbi:acetate/propionate family kinase [Vagococcus fluvialis]|uniref:acetate/propionate family kinase n=1 Tax=Vagococcus fluvialis TaxID=2738 RepID=UPI003B5BA7FB